MAAPEQARYMRSQRSIPTGGWRARQSPVQAIPHARGSGERLFKPVHDTALSSGAAEGPSPEALLQACAGGDRAALHSLYKLTAPRLFGLAHSIVHGRELAEDILQDSFVQVWHKAHRFDPGRGAAIAWLACIVRNRSLDLLRRRRREVPFDDTIMENWESHASNSADGITLSPKAQRLRDCIDELDENPRKSVLLAYYGGLTAEQVAGRLGAPLGTVKSWIRRSLMRLKRCVEE